MSLAREISNWIRQKVHDAGGAGVALGLSGGVDSAVVGGLAKMALGDNVLGLIMPCHSDPIDEEFARLVASKFLIRVERVDLAPTFDSLLGVLPPGDRMAVANLKPRLRMMTLYYHASRLGYLVAGTGNKSELSIGYFTKYGDGGVDILPIGDLLKTQVRELARELGVPEAVIERPPTAGLWAGQTDESEMGLTYEELDLAIARIERGDTSQIDRTILDRVTAMMNASAHKRALPEVCRIAGLAARLLRESGA